MDEKTSQKRLGADRLYWYGREWTGWSVVWFVGCHRMRRHTPIDAHRLKCFELGIVETGELHLRVANRRMVVKAGEVVVIPPETLIEDGGAPNAGMVYWVGIAVTEATLKECSPLVRGEVEELGRELKKVGVGTLAASEGLAGAARECFERVKGKAGALARQGAMAELLQEVLASLKSPGARSVAEADLIARALVVLEERLPQSVPVEELARVCRMSRTTFNGMFKRVTGVPPHMWISRRRVEIAAGHLRSGEESVEGVAMALGYSSGQYFASVFKKMMGVSPSEYRAKGRRRG